MSASICSLLAGCNDPGCIRNNQCTGGAVCALGSCVMPPADARVEGIGSDGKVEAGKTGDASELGVKEAGKEGGVDGIKPDGIKPDGIKLDGIKPDGIKPDGIKPDGIKPDGIKELGGG